MDIVEIMNNYSLIIVISGVLSSVICGLIKVPIVRRIREYGTLKQLDSKVVGGYIRNTCTIIVAILSVVFVACWYCFTEGIKVLLDIKVYAEILGAFTASKLIYMIYEGAGKASIKKLIHNVLTKVKGNKLMPATSGDSVTLSYTVQDFLINNVHLPLTQEQLDGLQLLLQGMEIK